MMVIADRPSENHQWFGVDPPQFSVLTFLIRMNLEKVEGFTTRTQGFLW